MEKLASTKINMIYFYCKVGKLMKEVQNQRQSNFELLRIVSMFMIVFWHVLLHTYILNNSSGTLHYIASFIYILLSVHINSFVLVTGYFQYKKAVKVKKVINLIGQVWFYNVLFVLLTLILGFKDLTPLEIFKDSTFLNMGGYWFINTYIALYLLTPFLNKYIENATQKEHKNTILVLFLLFSIVATITNQMTITNDGRSIIAFIFLYLTGAYFGKYPIKNSYHFRYNSKNKNQLIFLFSFLGLGFINFVFYHFGLKIAQSDNGIIQDIGTTLVASIQNFASPILILQSISYFLLFETFSIKKNWINKISPLMIGIYLIHENKYVCEYIYPRFFEPITNSSPPSIIIKLFLAACVMFLLSMIGEFIRKTLAKKISKAKIILKTNQKITNYIKEI